MVGGQKKTGKSFLSKGIASIGTGVVGIYVEAQVFVIVTIVVHI